MSEAKSTSSGRRVMSEPPDLNKAPSFEQFSKRVESWAIFSGVPKELQGNMLASALPDESEKYGNNIQSNFWEIFSPKDLVGNDGLDKVLNHLEKNLGKDKRTKNLEIWSNLISCSRKPNQKMKDYVNEFEVWANKLKAGVKVKLPNEILAYQLLIGAKVNNIQYEIIKGVIDLDDEDKVYESVKNKMINMFSETLGNVAVQDHRTKLDPVSSTSNEELHATQGYYRKKGFNGKSFDKGKDQRMVKDVNPKNAQGKIMRCSSCGSFRHLVKECPHSYEKMTRKKTSHKKQVYVLENNSEQEELVESESDSEYEVDRYCLFTTSNEELSQFTSESLNCAALDTCCTSTVAGEKWLKIYLEAIPEDYRSDLQGPMPSKRSFLFGNEGIMPSINKYILPVNLGGKKTSVETDVIASDIPMLLSKEEMKKAHTVLNINEDKATIYGNEIQLKTTSAGHYIVDLLKDTSDTVFCMGEVNAVDIVNADEETKMKTLNKLHKQFGHRPKAAFVNILKAANAWSKDFSEKIDKIIDNCEGCIMRRRNPDRPAVALPMACDFNEKVAMDLKLYKGKYILYLIDMFSRYTVAAVINRKRPSDVIDKIMEKWVAYHGVMAALLSDNGGEFNGEEMRQVKSKLNVIELTTGAESPWQNGLCEKNHALTDNILEQMDEDFPELGLETKLAWACMAKNTLQNVYGYSSFQLVYGKNPKLPNIVSDPPPSWEINSMSEALEKHLKALHSARRAFTKSESCAKLKLALKSKIRTVDRTYENGDIVYYKRDGEDRWLGPAKVVFQDGKIIFVRQGGYMYKVSANRLLPAGEELAKSIKSKEETDDKERSDSIRVLNQEMEFQLPDQVISDQETQNDGTNAVEEEMDITGQQTQQNNSSGNTDDSMNTPSGGQTRQIQNPPKFRPGEHIECLIQGDWKPVEIIKRGCKATGKYASWYNVRFEDGSVGSIDTSNLEIRRTLADEVNLTWMHQEVFANMVTGERRNSPECLEAKVKELAKLQEFSTYEVVDDIGQDYITTTWVLTDKEGDIRARLTARGFEEEDNIPKDSPTMNKSSLRLILAIASQRKWSIKTTDIKSAFLQGSKLEREVYVKPPKEANMTGKLWKLNKCLYGLRDASRQWYLKVEAKLRSLGFTQSPYDPGLFYLQKNGEVSGVVGLHVDDFLHAGDDHFETKVLPKLLEQFKVGKSELSKFMYTGFSIEQKDDAIILDQEKFVENIKIPTVEASRLLEKEKPLTSEEMTLLRRMVGTLNWVVRATRPDLSFDMISLSKKFKEAHIADLKDAKKILGNLKQSKAFITIPDLGDLSETEIVVFTDASWGNINNRIDSTAGYVIFWHNPKLNLCVPLDWKSNKIKRVVASTLAAETLSLSMGLDAAVGIAEMIGHILGDEVKQLQIHAFVDNKSTFEAIHSTSMVKEVRLRREIAMIKELLQSGKVKEVRWVPGEKQLADVLTKKGTNGSKLLSVMQSGRF